LLNHSEINLYYDSDVTAWAHKVLDKRVSDATLENFLSTEAMPPEFQGVCDDIQCQKELILRVWSELSWHGDMDIVVSSSFITSLNLESERQRRVFEENQKFINYIIENKHYDYYFKYFEPKITGVFLLLFYDAQYQKFLSKTSRRILKENLQEHYRTLEGAPIIARWGGGEDTVYGFNIVTINEKIPTLMYKFLIKHPHLIKNETK